MLRQQLVVALATITAREAIYYTDEMAEGTDLPRGRLDFARPDQ